MKQFNVGIIGATGMVGQRFATLLENHPWFHVKVLAASPRSAGRTYKEAVGARWCMQKPMPKAMEDMIIKDATADIEAIAKEVDFVFCAVDMKKDEIRALEEAYAKAECPVISNNSAHRFTKDVPMIVPELNADHAAIIPAQRKRLGTKRGFIAVNPTARFKVMYRRFSRCPNLVLNVFWSAHTRRFPARVKRLKTARRSSTT